MTRLILDLPGEEWTPEIVRAQVKRYIDLRHRHRQAAERYDWPRQREIWDQMAEVGDELIEAAVLHGTWSVEDAT